MKEFKEFLSVFGDQVDQWPVHVKSDIIGKCDITKHNIQLLSDCEPIKSRYHQIPPPMYEAVKVEIAKMLESSIVSP